MNTNNSALNALDALKYPGHFIKTRAKRAKTFVKI